MIDQLLKDEVQKFIKDHQFDDPFVLSLKSKKSAEFPLKEAIDQIHSLQKAKGKIPEWVAAEGIIWPAPISVEQASSGLTAKFKATQILGKSMADLTGGMGVDAYYYADKVPEIHYVEMNEELADVAKHNFKALGKRNIFVHNQSAEVFLERCNQKFDTIYLDPSRRDKNRKVFKINECTPNLYNIVPRCLKIAAKVLVKLSPMVDLSLVIQDFAPSQIWVISIKNEVKEVLCQIQEAKMNTLISAIDLAEHGKNVLFEFEKEEETSAQSEFAMPLTYMYEPSAAVMKAGAFKLVGQRFRLKKLHISSHLYTSDKLMEDFPGKVFVLKSQVKQDKKEIAKLIPDRKVNVFTRNYPLTPDQLKKKLDLKDGGENYLIGTTLMDNKKGLLLCERV